MINSAILYLGTPYSYVHTSYVAVIMRYTYIHMYPLGILFFCSCRLAPLPRDFLHHHHLQVRFNEQPYEANIERVQHMYSESSPQQRNRHVSRRPELYRGSVSYKPPPSIPFPPHQIIKPTWKRENQAESTLIKSISNCPTSEPPLCPRRQADPRGGWGADR